MFMCECWCGGSGGEAAVAGCSGVVGSEDVGGLAGHGWEGGREGGGHAALCTVAQ